jgi:hypothetical protein
MTRTSAYRSDHGPGTLGQLFALGMVGVLVVVILFLEPLHGPVLLSLSGNHGLDLGDVVALPFAFLGAWLLRSARLQVVVGGRDGRSRVGLEIQ